MNFACKLQVFENSFQLLPFTKFTLTDELNARSTLHITLDFEDFKKRLELSNITISDALLNGSREVVLYQGNIAIFTGQIVDVAMSNTRGTTSINIACYDYYGLLHKRIIGVPETVYTNTDAGLIAWGCINETQQSDSPYSDLGITMGNITPSKNRDKTYKFRYVDDAIETISNFNLKDGFDFDVDEFKKFNVYYPRKGQKREKLTITPNMVISWSVNKKLPRDLTNRIIVRGEESTYTVRTSDVGIREAYGLQEHVIQSQAKEMVNLEDRGDQWLTNNEAPLDSLRLEIVGTWPHNTFDVGDSLRIDVQDLALKYDWYRLTRRTTKYDNKDSLVYSMWFEQETGGAWIG